MSKLKLDRCGNWYQFLICPPGGLAWIDGDSSIPAFVPLTWKDWHISWWNSRRERIAKRMAQMLVDS